MSDQRDRREKEAVARSAAGLVTDDQLVALGSGSTVALVAAALGERGSRARFAAASPATALAATSAGLTLVDDTTTARYDLAIDGADEVAADGWAVKGGGGAHTRERILISAADRFVCVVGASKLVDRLTWPVPLELQPFALASTVERLPGVVLRDAPPTADGGVLADLAVPLDDPAAVAARLDATPGIVDHGLFAPDVVRELLIAHGDHVEHRRR
ncbi:ribose 5-phosphate isomerase A [Patulibacter sp.]|uniref:ribose 5-phosphate isomerase A n=1 Tax=Patulibacter sp. TaxID=1912859 RepID=UPI0027159C9D|nr:ribose 5-phosphate isomerase A [Patulibacter sp.]MDO9409822.1 ribose 5-phosphate isomerase A [Patulibacter sp.]